MKKIIIVILAVIGSVLMLSAAGNDEMYGAAFPLSHLLMQLWGGVMLVGISFALARWE